MDDIFIPPFDDDEELNVTPTAKKQDDVDEVSMSESFAALMARFGEAEEDQKIREEGFELAQKGGLIRKPRPEDKMGYYMSGAVDKRDEIKTDADSELSRVFDSAKSEHDSDGVDFSDLEIKDAPEAIEPKIPEKEEEPVVEEPAVEETEEVPEEPPKKKRGRPRKNPLPEEAPEAEKKSEEKAEEKIEEAIVKKEAPKKETAEPPAASVISEDENETVEMVRKYNTHTKVIFVDNSIDDGIKRNSDEELDSLFNNEKGRKRSWLRRKK